MAYHQGKFVWFEIMSTDVERAKAFYTELLNWKAEPMTMGDFEYILLKNGETGIGGILPTMQENMPSHWLSYVAVDDVDAKAKAVEEAGGKLVMPANDIPGVGRMALVQDPQGGHFHLFKPADDEGEDPAGRPGDFHWNELWTSDDTAALAFYEGVFGYSHDTMKMGEAGDYYILMAGEKSAGGMMKSPEASVPVTWLPYVHVADVDATTERAHSMGAEVKKPPSDIPGVGRFSIVADPTGGVLGYITPADQG